MDERLLAQAMIDLSDLNRQVWPRARGNQLNATEMQTLLLYTNVHILGQQDIAKMLGVRASSVGGALATLRRDGYVTPKTDPEDARRQFNIPTRAGRAAAQRFLARGAHYLDEYAARDNQPLTQVLTASQ